MFSIYKSLLSRFGLFHALYGHPLTKEQECITDILWIYALIVVYKAWGWM